MRWRGFKVAYFALTVAFLVQWGKPSPWARIDLFSGGYLFLRLLPLLRSLLQPLRSLLQPPKASPSGEWKRERWGSTSAPGWVGWAFALMIADLAVFLDYGHWRLEPALQRPYLQAFGLVLYVTVSVWLKWTDRKLGAAFATEDVRPKLLQSGPFRFVRPPYYSGAILQKIAVALIFASVIGWVLVVPWCVLLVRQVRLEEVHLHKIFGSDYEAYARRTSRLVPGIF